MTADLRVACIKLNALADHKEVRKAMALAIDRHCVFGIRPTWRIASSAAGTGQAVADTKPGPTSAV